MLRTVLTLVAGSVLLAGCGGNLDDVSKAAEGARVSTERMADRAEAASNAKQEQIFADAAEMQRADAGRQGPRFEARKDGAGDNWMIYDTVTGAPAMVGAQVQTGLSRAQAQATLSHMEDPENQIFRK